MMNRFERRVLPSLMRLIAFEAAIYFLGTALSVAEDPLWNDKTTNPTTYRILPRPLPEHVGKHLPYSTTQQPVEKPIYESRPVSPYTYGWFGPQASPHWSRHFGYHQRYTQWSLK